MQDLGSIGHILGQSRLKIEHAMKLRVGAGENAGVRGRRQWRLRISAGEHCGLLRQRVEIGRETTVGTKKAHSVGAGGVKRDEENVGRRRMRCGRLRRRGKCRRQYHRCQYHRHKQTTNQKHSQTATWFPL